MAHGAEPVRFQFRTNDVIAFVGGEDVVEMQRNGYLELLLTAALPHHKLRFRNLAFEGDTVFEQHRQLNFPSWEKQLERVGATVVIAQFGQAESLKGTNELPRFIEAYSNLADLFLKGGRRLILLSPTPFAVGPENLKVPPPPSSNGVLERYVEAIREFSKAHSAEFVDLFGPLLKSQIGWRATLTRDGLHLSRDGHLLAADTAAIQVGIGKSLRAWERVNFHASTIEWGLRPEQERLRQLIIEKNRLWFDYWRPQNWAFLNGDRTEQPSSRDHRDPKKRWFPEEMEKFLPMIEAKEREIWEEAAKLR